MLTTGSLFSGVGLLDYGLHLAGLEHRWFVERTEFRRRILELRYPGCEVHDDVRTFDALRAPRVDVIAGGFPCRGASTAGQRTGFDHPETALWHEFARIIRDARPRYVLVENVANLLAVHDGALWGTVLRDLAALGFDAWWDCLPAAAFGAPHLRDRVFLVAVANSESERRGSWPASDAERHDERAPAGRRAVRPAANSEGGRSAVALRQETSNEHVHAGRDANGRRDRVGPAGSGRVDFNWGRFEPAIRRWEAIHGPAPEPFIPRMADGSTRGVDGPRVSALGDGVLVHAGQYVGELLMALDSSEASPGRSRTPLKER